MIGDRSRCRCRRLLRLQRAVSTAPLLAGLPTYLRTHRVRPSGQSLSPLLCSFALQCCSGRHDQRSDRVLLSLYIYVRRRKCMLPRNSLYPSIIHLRRRDAATLLFVVVLLLIHRRCLVLSCDCRVLINAQHQMSSVFLSLCRTRYYVCSLAAAAMWMGCIQAPETRLAGRLDPHPAPLRPVSLSLSIDIHVCKVGYPECKNVVQ